MAPTIRYCTDIRPVRQLAGLAALLTLCLAMERAEAQPAGPVTSTLRTSVEDMCADVSNASQTPGANVVVWTCTGGTNQSWQVSPAGGGQFQIVATHSNQCLDVWGERKDAGTPVIQWTCNGQDNQRFSLVPQRSGYAIVAKHSGLCVMAVGRNLVQQETCDGSAAQTWIIDGALALRSRWSPPYPLSIVPSAAANLPDGRVLTWSAGDRFNFPGPSERTFTSIFDPVTNTATEALISHTNHDMFCPGISNLPDGRIFVSGGISSTRVSIFNPATMSWAPGPEMNIGRGYQSGATLSDGGVFVLGGSWSGGEGGKDGETWHAATGWRRNSAVLASYFLTDDKQGLFRSDNHAWLFAGSNGRVFHAGPSKAMYWIDTAGNGSVTPAGYRGNDGHAMNGFAAMYDIGKILTTGGAPDYQDSFATANAHVITLNGNQVSVRQVAPMAYARAFHNGVVLPNGQVVIIGGQNYAVPFSDDGAVLTPELWDPATDKFYPLARMAIPRTYHSVALLLPDGRVLAGGGGLCGGCPTNHPDVEILTPPYLLNPDGTAAARPAIVAAPADAQLGTAMVVRTDSAVTAFSLVRLSSSTHSINTEQRRIPLTFTRGTAGEYQLSVPADPGVVVPGYYMLFALNAAGVPSHAATVRIH